MICVDNNFLVLYFGLPAKIPDDPNTGQPIAHLSERLEGLKETWKDTNQKILLPDPVLCEFLIFAGEDAPKYLAEFQKASNIEIRPFDTRAAVELAAMYWDERKKLKPTELEEFQKIDTKTRLKFDRQIVAIAKAHGVESIYSNDRGVKAFADLHGITVIRMWELEIPAPKEPLFELLKEQPMEEEAKAASSSAAADPASSSSEPSQSFEPVPEND